VSSAILNEGVIVYAEKPLIENTDGKITYNVGEKFWSSGSSTSELLKTMPTEPKTFIDDKPTDL